MTGYMMATAAFTPKGVDLSHDKPGLCFICREDADNYYGNWEDGFSFFDLRFPRVGTRALTVEEIARYCDSIFTVNGHPAHGYACEGGRLVSWSLKEIRESEVRR